MSHLNILVIGESGDGKSTMIDALRMKDCSHSARSGKDPRGVTKEVTMYPAALEKLASKVFLIDTPGIGDHDISIVALLTMLETCLAPDTLPGGIHGILVTCPIYRCRMSTAHRILQQLVDLGFQAPLGQDKYDHIILVGTKLDKADVDDPISFVHGVNGYDSVQRTFFEDSLHERGTAVMVSKEDYSPLLGALEKLLERTGGKAIVYEPPEVKLMATTLIKKVCSEFESIDALADQLMTMRNVLQGFQVEMKELFHLMQAESAEDLETLSQDTERLKDFFLQREADSKRATEALRRQVEEMKDLEQRMEEEKLFFEEKLAEARGATSSEMTNMQKASKITELEVQRAEAIDRLQLESTLKLELSRGMDALNDLGEDLLGGRSSAVKLTPCKIRSAVEAFHHAREASQKLAESQDIELANTVRQEGHFQNLVDKKKLEIEECRKILKAMKEEKDSQALEMQDLEKQIQQATDEQRRFEEEADSKARLRKGMHIGGGIAMAIPIIGWLVGGTTLAIAELAVKKAQIAASCAARHCSMLAGFRKNLLQHRKEKMDHLQRSCEQKHLRLGGIQEELKQLKHRGAELRQSLQEIQVLVEKTSRIWEVVTDIFGNVAAAGDMMPVTASRSFQIQLLRDPLMAIAEAKGFEHLVQHKLVSSNRLENISSLLRAGFEFQVISDAEV